MFNRYIQFLHKAIQQPLPGQVAHLQMMPPGRSLNSTPALYRNGGVLLHLFPVDGEPHLLFIKRSDDGKVHGGQIAFPGGKFEQTDNSFLQTALRESFEEVGMNQVQIVGALSNLYIPVSTFMVHPYISFAMQEQVWKLNAQEVDAVIRVSLKELLHAKSKSTIDIETSRGVIPQVPCYQIQNEIIWGATAMITQELLTLSKPFFLKHN
jgi:8-oxo-dGTP pyrophosphatase MutT (NUDIX family)